MDDTKAKIKERESITRKFLEKVFVMYPGIEMWGIKDVLTDTKAFAIGKAQSVEEAMHILRRENAFWKNEMYAYDFYFKPVKVEKLNYVFFDFDMTPDPEILRNAYLVVQTSTGKYHIYIRAEEPVETQEYKGIVKAMMKHIEVIGDADPACVDPYHLRRIAGFLNNKHKDWEIRYAEGKNIPIPKHTIEKAREYAIAEGYAVKAQENVKVRQMQSSINGDAAVWLEQHANDRLVQYRDTRVMTRQQFSKYIHTNDQSVIDFAFACYLFSKGWSVKEIFDVIRDQREDLVQKHPMWIDYLKRTIEKAGVKMYREMQKKSKEYQEVMKR